MFGVPHPEMGEVVHAVVQPVAMPADRGQRRRSRPSSSSTARARLAPLKCPRTIDLRAELPRTETGKLLKRLLKDEYAARAAS